MAADSAAIGRRTAAALSYDKQLLQGSVRERDFQATMEIADATTGKVLRKVAVRDI